MLRVVDTVVLKGKSGTGRSAVLSVGKERAKTERTAGPSVRMRSREKPCGMGFLEGGGGPLKGPNGGWDLGGTGGGRTLGKTRFVFHASMA